MKSTNNLAALTLAMMAMAAQYPTSLPRVVTSKPRRQLSDEERAKINKQMDGELHEYIINGVKVIAPSKAKAKKQYYKKK